MIPQRKNDVFNSSKGFKLTSNAVFKTMEQVLIFVQTDQGDLFSVCFENKENLVSKIKMIYIDTVPVASCMVFLNKNTLFLAAKSGDHFLYEIVSCGSEDEMTIINKEDVPELHITCFEARKLENLKLLFKLENISPVVHCSIMEHCSGYSDIYIACGSGPSSNIRKMNYVSIPHREKKTLQDLYNLRYISSLKREEKDDFHSYIIICKQDKTYVLDNDLNDVNDPYRGFSNDCSLACFKIRDDVFVQVLMKKLRYIKISESICGCDIYNIKQNGNIYMAAAYKNHFVLCLKIDHGLSQYLFCYGLVENEEFNEKAFMASNSKFLCMEFTPEGNIAIAMEKSVTVYALTNVFSELVKVDFECEPSSIAFFNINENSKSVAHMFIGFNNGYIQSAIWNAESKTIEKGYFQKIGNDSVKLTKVETKKIYAIIAMSTATWIISYYKNKLHIIPFFEDIHYAASFCSKNYSSDFLALKKTSSGDVPWELCVFGVEDIETLFTEYSIQLPYSTHQFIMHTKSQQIIISECDPRPPYHKQREINPYTAMENAKQVESEMEIDKEDEENIKILINSNSKKAKSSNVSEANYANTLTLVPMESEELIFKGYHFEEEDYEISTDDEISSDEEYLQKNSKVDPQIVEIRSTYDAVIQVLDTVKKQTLLGLMLGLNESVTSTCLVRHRLKYFLILGVKKDIILIPSPKYNSFLRTYKLSGDRKKFVLRQELKITDVLYAICPIEEELLVSVGNLLCLYKFEDYKLKCVEYKEMPEPVLLIETKDNFFIVGDTHNGLHYGYVDKQLCQLHLFHEDQYLLSPTCVCLWNDYILAGADNSGNIRFIKLPRLMCEAFGKSEMVDDVSRCQSENAEIIKVEHVIKTFYTSLEKSFELLKYNVGGKVISLQKARLFKEGCDMIFYTTAEGAIGALLPCTNIEDVGVFKKLQFLLQFQVRKTTNIYFEILGPGELDECFVINGSICEQFWVLKESYQETLAKKLGMSVHKVKELLLKVRTLMYIDPAKYKELDKQ